MKRRTYTYRFEMEHGDATVEYEADFHASPGEPAITQGPSDYWHPGAGPEVEDVTVYFLRHDYCPKHRYQTQRNADKEHRLCRECKTVRERRPELDEVIDSDELLEHAGYTEECDAGDAADRAYCAWRDEQMERGV